MDLLKAVFLGIIQGLTEFIPVSSSGHLVLFQQLLGVEGNSLVFDVAVHIATLTAVIAIYRSDVLDIIKRPFGKLPVLIAVGTIPALVVGLAFKGFFDRLFESGAGLGINFLITGTILLLAGTFGNGEKGLKQATFIDAVLVGVMQAIAIAPAISRSGFTITGSLARGFNREFAAKFSFLISIPAILGAALISMIGLVKGEGGSMAISPVHMIAGFMAAALSGYLAVKFMIGIIRKGRFRMFSYYVYTLGVLILVDQIFFNKFFPPIF